MKNLALLLMAGKSERFNAKKPKQFQMINNVPLFIYAIDTFYKNKKINKIYLVIDFNYYDLVLKWLKKFNYNLRKIKLISGSTTRMLSLFNGTKEILNDFKNEDVKVISHDVARCFVESKIVNKHVNISLKNGEMINTVLPLNDSIIKIENNAYKILDRSNIFIIQTPQTFINSDVYKILNDNFYKVNNFNDICSLGISFNLKIRENVKGSLLNYKITLKDDLLFVSGMLKNMNKFNLKNK